MDLRLDELLDAAPVGIVHFDLDGRATYANRCWRSITGCRDAIPIASDVLLSLLHPADRERATRSYTQVLETGQPHDVLLRVLRPEGVRVVQARTESLRDESSAVIGFVSSLVDVSPTLTDRDVAGPARYRLLHDQAPVGLMLSSTDGALLEVNRTMAEMLGTSQAELVGMYPWDIFHPEDLARIMAEFAGLVVGKPAFVAEPVRMLRADGSALWVVGASTLVEDDDGNPTSIQSMILDVTSRRESEELLRASEERHRTTVDSLSEGVVLHRRGHLEAFNQSSLRLLGLTAEQLSEPDEVQRRLEPIDASGRPVSFKDLPGVVAVGRGAAVIGEVIGISTPDGRRWLSVNAQPIFEGDELTGVVTTLTDVTERKLAEEALTESEQRYKRLAQIVESTSDLVGTVDPADSSLVYLNQAARELFGFTERDFSGTDVRDLYTERAAHIWESEIAVELEMGRTWTGELDMKRPDGEVLHVLQSVSSDVGPDHLIRQVSFVGRDVTAQRRREIDLAHQATHDSLTGLPNRTLLLELVEHALARTERQPGHVALLFLDLDRFKGVNDNIGHEAGDELLRAVAERIGSALRPSDIVARLGGDEFVVLCEEIRDEYQAVTVTQRIISAIESTPFSIRGASLNVTASVGIALSSGEGSHPEGLLRDADAAMYRAKELGRARHELFDDEMRTRSARRLALADELTRAVEQGEITVHYQPLIDLRTGRVEGVEALARWEHPSRGTLPPWEFIGVAEETGLIVGLGLSVLGQACAQARRWEVELGSRAPKVHVNLSARQLAQPNLPRLVQGVIDQALIDPGRLCLEVTESVLMEDAATSAKVLAELKNLGIELAIDDFGTGYSSLAYLRRFPVDVLKIDRSFVDGLGPDPDDSAIVSAIVNLAHTLDLVSVAEGVETTEQLEGLRALGCRSAQGFLFARPQPVPEVNRYLTTVFPVNGVGPEISGS